MSGITSTSTEITLTQQTHEHTLKINNFKRFIITQKEYRSNYIEIFPGKKIAFVIKTLPETSPNGQKYFKYTLVSGGRSRDIEITKNDKFFCLELLADESGDAPRLAGKVEIILGDTNQAFNFGDPLNEKYLDFDGKRSLVLKMYFNLHSVLK